MATTYFRSWRDVPADAWRWANFSPAEIACRVSVRADRYDFQFQGRRSSTLVIL